MSGLEARTALTRPFRAGDAVAVLLHGRGSDMHDLLGLRAELPPELALVAPRAPFPAAPWGYGPGWAWYRYVAEDRVVPKTLLESLQRLDAFLDALPELLGKAPGTLLIGGFSQGGTTSLAYGVTRPSRVTSVANFSGFLAAEPRLPVESNASSAPPIFWGHGEIDPAIPHALAVRGRSRLRAAGARLTARDYPIGHQISAQELRDFVDWWSALRTADSRE